MDNSGWIVSAYLAGAIVSGSITYMYGTRVLGWKLVRNTSQEGTIYWISLFWPVVFPLGVLIEGYRRIRHKQDSARQEKMTVTMHVATPDDGSLLIEWISEHWRLGLILEKIAHESSYYYVTDEAMGSIGESDGLSAEQRAMIADFVRDWEAGQ